MTFSSFLFIVITKLLQICDVNSNLFEFQSRSDTGNLSCCTWVVKIQFKFVTLINEKR